MLVPQKDRLKSDYRYGFNGMEKDDELKGEGSSINYETRMQDTRIGRFLSVDPLTKTFPHYSPYQFAGNTPIQAIDLDGAEEYHYLAKWDKKSGKIVFKLETKKTVYRKSFFGYTWIPREEHTVVYQNSSGGTTEYVFQKGGTMVQISGPMSTPVALNTPESLRKFVFDSNKIKYQNGDAAESAFEKEFLSVSGERAFTAANAMIVYGQYYNTPVEENAPKISKTRELERIPDSEIIVIATQNKGNNPNNFLLRPADNKPLGNVIEPGKSATIANDFDVNNLINKMFGRDMNRNDKILGASAGDIRAAGFDIVRAPTSSNPDHVRIISAAKTFDQEGRSWLDAAFDFISKGSNKK